MLTQALPWVPPLDAAAALTQDESCWVLLYSGQQPGFTGRYSYLALHPQDKAAGDDFAVLADRLRTNNTMLDGAWFGYMGYELLHQLESLPEETQDFISLPRIWFTRFGLILQFDHQEQCVLCHREADIAMPEWPPDPIAPTSLPEVTTLGSPMPREAYLALVEKTREAIIRGDFYQANITRKFTGEFASPTDPLALFLRLCEASPAAYSAVLHLGNASIISSSPERFLHIDAGGRMETRPIKGTAPRESDPAKLQMSEKDRAENLMIVDLMRNDLARTAIPGSVQTERLFEVSSYATLHHMASTVSGQKRPDVSTLDAVKHCFPPGSMTGAPKFRAMEWCLAHEGIQRGVYSGALGWFGGDGSCDLSVVIRTLVVDGARFEFQVGGGIVVDSEPEKEWQETMTKARGILKALEIDVQWLEKI